MCFYSDIDKLRDRPATTAARVEARDDRELHAIALREETNLLRREAAEASETIQEIFEHASLWMTESQKQRAQSMLIRHDYRKLGQLLCDVHEQLVTARLENRNPKRVVLWDED